MKLSQLYQRISQHIPRPLVYWCVQRVLCELLEREVLPQTIAHDIDILVYNWSQE